MGIFKNQRESPEFILNFISWIFVLKSQNEARNRNCKIHWIHPNYLYGSNIPEIFIAAYFRFLAHHVIDELIDEINDEPVRIEL